MCALSETKKFRGSEYGESWHHAGNLQNKQNVFGDFAACVQHPIDAKYTSPQHLAIEGLMERDGKRVGS